MVGGGGHKPSEDNVERMVAGLNDRCGVRRRGCAPATSVHAACVLECVLVRACAHPHVAPCCTRPCSPLGSAPSTHPRACRQARGKQFSRRRRHSDDKDVDYINDRNAHFNKKVRRRGGACVWGGWEGGGGCGGYTCSTKKGRGHRLHVASGWQGGWLGVHVAGGQAGSARRHSWRTPRRPHSRPPMRTRHFICPPPPPPLRRSSARLASSQQRSRHTHSPFYSPAPSPSAQIERAFGKFTAEIKANLERGTALPDH